MKKRYSILGCGWLGVDLAKQFIKEGVAINGSTTSIGKLNILEEQNIIPFLVDIEAINSSEINSFLQSEVLVVLITSKSIEAFKECISFIEQSSVKKVVFISSTGVYPSVNKEITEEDKTLDIALTTIENLFIENNYFETTVLRFAGLFGSDRQPGNWFENRKIPNPDGFVNMIHKDDCIRIITKIIENNIWNQVFNACASHHPTRRAFYTKARKCIGKTLPYFDETSVASYKIINSDKLLKRLGYLFKYNDLLKSLE